MQFYPGLLRKWSLQPTLAHLLPPQATTYIITPVVGALTTSHLSEAQTFSHLIIVFRNF